MSTPSKRTLQAAGVRDGQRPDGCRIVHPPGMLRLFILLLVALRAALRSRAEARPGATPTRSRPDLGGLHHVYERDA